MPIEFDKKDKRIYYELDKNARQPLSAIAKKVNLSRESVLYRLNKYHKEGVIRDYLTVINMSKLGFDVYKMYVKLHNITEDQEKELIDYVCSNPRSAWCGSCDGKYSHIFAISARNLVELNKTIRDINNKFWKYFLDVTIIPIVYARYYYRDYLIGDSGTTEREILWGGDETAVDLDDVDIEILDKLSVNSRVSAVEIAGQLNVSSDSVLKRIKNLQDKGVIEHYMLWSNVNLLKGVYYKVLVSLNNLNDETERKIDAYCLQNPNIVFEIKVLGAWQLEMDIEVENIKELRVIVRDFINMFPDNVSDYSVLNIYEEHKYRFFSKELFLK